MKMSRAISILGFLASWAIALVGNFVWIETNIGAATGSVLFGWLWLPGFALSIALLLQRTRLGGFRVASLLAALISFALGYALVVYDWARSEFLLEKATAHSGVQVNLIEEFSLQPSVYLAGFLLIVSGSAATYMAFAKSQNKNPSKSATEPASNFSDADPRSIWDEQSN